MILFTRMSPSARPKETEELSRRSALIGVGALDELDELYFPFDNSNALMLLGTP